MNPITPARRVIRTVVQVVLALGAAVPAAVAVLGVSAGTVAAVSGIAGATVILISAAQNAWDQTVGNA